MGRQWTEDRARQTGDADAQGEERGRGKRKLQRMSDMETSGRTGDGPSGGAKPAAGASTSPGREAAAFGSDLQSSIGRQLRSMYNDLLQEPVPDRFLQLLSDLEGKEAASPSVKADTTRTGDEPVAGGASPIKGENR